MTDTTNRLPTYDDPFDEIGEHGGINDVPRVRGIRDAHQERLDSIVRTVEQRGATALNASEQRAFDAHRSQITQLDALAARYEERAARAAWAHRNSPAMPGQVGGTFHTGGGHTYRKGDPNGHNWLKDMALFGLRGDPDAAERLHRNNREVAIEHRALSTTDGAGGEFVPPLWAVNQFVELARPAQVTANLVRHETLPPGTDQINVPKVVTGTAVAEQATQNTAIQNTDATTTSVAANVATIAGGQTVSLQLIEQSPVNVSDMLLQDLISDLAAKTNLYVLQNNAVGKRGLLSASGINAVTYTDASPTVGELFSKLAEAMRQVQVGVYRSPTAIVMSPTRWAWHLAALDTANRPLVVPDASGPYNALGNSGVAGADGRVGTLLGLPVFVDPLMPANLGAGTNEDRIIVGKFDDAILYESGLKAEAFREVAAANLSVYLRVYRYVAFTAERQPKSFSVVSGTGLVQPVL